MVSPSISSTKRRTPCVDGCCGPMLRTMECSPTPAVPCCWASAMTSSTPGRIMSGAAVGDIGETFLPVPFDRVVLAQGMALPVGGHHNAGEAGMAGEVDAEQVEDLALIEVRRGPDVGDGWDGELVRVQPNDEADALLHTEREERVGELD